MDREALDRLMTQAAPEDRERLEVLRAEVDSLREAATAPGPNRSADLRELGRMEDELDRVAEKIRARVDPGNRSFGNILEVVDHLSGEGFKVSKSTAYNHQKQGRLRPRADGRFHVQDVERYARDFLERVGDAAPELDDLQRRRAESDLRKSRAQAEMIELNLSRQRGDLVPRDEYERALAFRAAVFRSDLLNFALSVALDVVALAGGDPGSVSDVAARLRDGIETALARYDTAEAFPVDLEVPADV
ncbi:MAG: hypothetical protein ABIJ95_10495 [Pseudomonadota bacterium]